MKATLHYIYDPLCGWCYAAESLLASAQDAPLTLRLHAGGLFPRATQLPAAMRQHIRTADGRIGEMSGQVFGEAYLDGLLADPATVYDSRPPIAAILVMESLQAGSGPAMLKAIQHAHYRDGRRVVEPAVLAELAAGLGVTRDAFDAAFEKTRGDATHEHLAETHRFMQDVGAQGFPTFVLQRGDSLTRLRHERCYGDPAAFARALASAESP